MDLQFMMELTELPTWRILKREILSQEFKGYKNSYNALYSYELVHVLVDESGEPKLLKKHENDVESYVAFTSPELASRLDKTYTKDTILSSTNILSENPSQDLKIMMMGQFACYLKGKGLSTSIKINPVFVEVAKGAEPLLMAEDVVFAPQYDEFTQKYLITDPDDAKALLAIRPDDEKRFGIEVTYYMITDRDLPEEKEEREQFLRNKIEELAFMAPRVPIRRGSGSFLAILLNLENDIEERAFIREYGMFDHYSDPIFVTSQLKIFTGSLQEIPYDGARIDTIFGPLIEWQKEKSPRP